MIRLLQRIADTAGGAILFFLIAHLTKLNPIGLLHAFGALSVGATFAWWYVEWQEAQKKKLKTK